MILTPKIRRCFLFSIFDVILLFDLNEYEGNGRSHQQIYLQFADFFQSFNFGHLSFPETTSTQGPHLKMN